MERAATLTITEATADVSLSMMTDKSGTSVVINAPGQMISFVGLVMLAADASLVIHASAVSFPRTVTIDDGAVVRLSGPILLTNMTLH